MIILIHVLFSIWDSHDFCSLFNEWVWDTYKHHLSRLVTKPTKWPLRPVKTQISLRIHPVRSETSLSAWRNIGSLATHWGHCKDCSDWVDAQADLNLCWAHIILLAVSWGGSFVFLEWPTCHFQVVTDTCSGYRLLLPNRGFWCLTFILILLIRKGNGMNLRIHAKG